MHRAGHKTSFTNEVGPRASHHVDFVRAKKAQMMRPAKADQYKCQDLKVLTSLPNSAEARARLALDPCLLTYNQRKISCPAGAQAADPGSPPGAADHEDPPVAGAA